MLDIAGKHCHLSSFGSCSGGNSLFLDGLDFGVCQIASFLQQQKLPMAHAKVRGRRAKTKSAAVFSAAAATSDDDGVDPASASTSANALRRRERERTPSTRKRRAAREPRAHAQWSELRATRRAGARALSGLTSNR